VHGSIRFQTAHPPVFCSHILHIVVLAAHRLAIRVHNACFCHMQNTTFAFLKPGSLVKCFTTITTKAGLRRKAVRKRWMIGTLTVLLGLTFLSNRLGPQRCWSPLLLLITVPSHLLVRRVCRLLLRPSYPPLLPLVIMKFGVLCDMNYLEGWAPVSLSYRLTIWEGKRGWTGNYRWEVLV
jgi:hypothetical protein